MYILCSTVCLCMFCVCFRTPGKYMFVEHFWNIPLIYSQYNRREILNKIPK